MEQGRKIEMLFIDNEQHYDPMINLAIEEYCLKYLDPDETYLLFTSISRRLLLERTKIQ